MMGGSGIGGGMMAAGCAYCHGLDGRGRVTQTFTAPDITYANLTDPAGMLQPDGSRGPTYTDAALRRAVTQGIDPEGGKLAQPMPQWRLTDQEWTDLLAYLKTLH
jgi:cytochrome c1